MPYSHGPLALIVRNDSTFIKHERKNDKQKGGVIMI